MIAPAFGFSVGDFIAGIHIAKKAVEALSEANGATYDYTLAITWLDSLDFVLPQVQALVGTSFTFELVQRLHTLAHACSIPVSRFLRQAIPYDEYLNLRQGLSHDRPRSSYARTSGSKMKWAMQMMKALEEMRKQIAPYLNQIIICLQLIACSHTEHTSQRLRSLEDVIIGQAARLADLSTAMRDLQQGLHRPSLSSSKLSDESILISLQYDSRTVPFSVKRTRQISSRVTQMTLPCQSFSNWPTIREYLILQFDGIPQISRVTSHVPADASRPGLRMTTVEEITHYNFEPEDADMRTYDRHVAPGNELNVTMLMNQEDSAASGARQYSMKDLMDSTPDGAWS